MTKNAKRKFGWREWLAKILMGAGLGILLLSLPAPYWHLKVKAPQYPSGLNMIIHLDRLAGDVFEIDMLNHYIGMRKSADAAKIERRLSRGGVILIAVFLFIAAAFRSRWSALLTLPAMLFPLIFATDLFWWLRDSGLNLDPKAPLSSSVKPFVPPLFGEGKIAQFVAIAKFDYGFYLSVAAAGLVLLALLCRFWQRRVDNKAHCPLPVMVFAFWIFASTGWAQTFTVSPEGPYHTIDAAVASADEGDTVLVRQGTYRGPLKVEKSVTLLGEGLPVLDGGGQGTVVSLTAPGIVFSGFKVVNSGDYLSADDAGLRVSAPGALIENNVFENVLFGIDLKNSSNTVVRNNVLHGKKMDPARRGDLIRVWYSHDTVLESNRTQNGRDVVLWYSKHTTVKKNHFAGGRYGLHFMYCNDSVVADNSLERNSVGAYLMYSANISMRGNFILSNRGPSGYGVGFKDMTGAEIHANVVADNRVAFFLDGVSGTFENNVLAYNDLGIEMLPTASDNRFHANSFLDNGEQVTIEGMGKVLANDWRGNFWSDYRGYDADRDGIGDQPYHAVQFFERLTDRYPSFKIFNGNLSAQALDLASKIFPLFAPQPAFTDSSPAMSPIQIMSAEKQPISWPWIFFSGTLLLPTLGVWQRHSKAAWPKVSAASPSASLISSLPRGNNPETVVHVRSLEKTFGRTRALKSLDFTVQKGETLVLWGPNGAGKTTALRCLLGIMPFKGDLKVMGLDVTTQGKEVRKRVGYVPQEIRMHTDQTVQETVRFYAALRRVSLPEASRLVDRWGLTEAKHKRVNALSGGMKQKLALVIALLSDPPILFLDESTNHLDLNARRDFISLLSNLKNAGKTIVLCSHRHSEVWKLADRVVVLKAGKKITEGTPEEVRNHLGGRALLALTVKTEHAAQAAALLQENGIRAEQNGSQILIEVPLDKKTLPFALLHEASISVLDYELESDATLPEAL